MGKWVSEHYEWRDKRIAKQKNNSQIWRKLNHKFLIFIFVMITSLWYSLLFVHIFMNCFFLCVSSSSLAESISRFFNPYQKDSFFYEHIHIRILIYIFFLNWYRMCVCKSPRSVNPNHYEYRKWTTKQCCREKTHAKCGTIVGIN